MNKRIKELIELANLEGAIDLIDCNAGDEGIGMEIFEEFAKIVAKDCMALAMEIYDQEHDESQTWPEDTYFDGRRSGALDAKSAIERTFVREEK